MERILDLIAIAALGLLPVTGSEAISTTVANHPAIFAIGVIVVSCSWSSRCHEELGRRVIGSLRCRTRS